ncbi:hypothetical protein [Porphyrobacter sp. AAP82]|uniref:hypothetical protein n=1 Tax=Porphyrobacter sp. AAP82 TaxID=1248917 RepID=UPI0012DF3EAD|nr:hypothetical protein [Porphyrobacter sp. AAP82]
MTDDRRHWAQSNADPEPGAPPGVRPISLDAMNHLGVDGEGNLYWIDTKILTTKKEFRLSFFQGAVALVTAVSAAIAAGAAVYSSYLEALALEAQQPTSTILASRCLPPEGAILQVDPSAKNDGTFDFTTENCITDNAYRFAGLGSSFEDAVGAVTGACRWEISSHVKRMGSSEAEWRDRARFRVAEARTGKCLTK